MFFAKVTKVRKVKIKNKKYLLRRVVRNIGRINRALLNLYKKKQIRSEGKISKNLFSFTID